MLCVDDLEAHRLFKTVSRCDYIARLCFLKWLPSEFIQCPRPPSGPLLGYPLLGVSTLIQSVNIEPGTSAAMVSACVSRCMLKVNHHAFFYHKRKCRDYGRVNSSSGSSHAGHEAGGKSGAGATDVAGGDCRGGAPQRRAGGLGSKARNHPRHPESSWQQGADSECAPGWDDGERTHDSNMLSVAFRDELMFKRRSFLFKLFHLYARGNQINH